MGYSLSKRSEARLEKVHPDLVRVVRRAIEITTVDFTVLEGARSYERQVKLFQAGATKTMNSRHLILDNGWAHAVDLGAYVDGEVRWDWPLYNRIYDAMVSAAKYERIPIRWGGDWDMDGEFTDEKWRDGPHYELPRQQYPG